MIDLDLDATPVSIVFDVAGRRYLVSADGLGRPECETTKIIAHKYGNGKKFFFVAFPILSRIVRADNEDEALDVFLEECDTPLDPTDERFENEENHWTDNGKCHDVSDLTILPARIMRIDF